jgi:hypothetical protein
MRQGSWHISAIDDAGADDDDSHHRHSPFAPRHLATTIRCATAAAHQEREIFELFLKLPVPRRKVAREVIVALAKANGVQAIPVGQSD